MHHLTPVSYYPFCSYVHVPNLKNNNYILVHTLGTALIFRIIECVLRCLKLVERVEIDGNVYYLNYLSYKNFCRLNGIDPTAHSPSENLQQVIRNSLASPTPSTAELNQMAVLLQDRDHHLEVINHHLVQVERSVVSKIWKPENQRFASVAACVRECLNQAYQHMERVEKEERDGFLNAVTKLDEAYQKFLRRKKAVSPELMFSVTSFLAEQREQQNKTFVQRSNALDARENALQARGDTLGIREQALYTHEAAINSFELLQDKTRKIEADLQAKQRKWHAEMVQTPIARSQKGEALPLFLREQAKAGEDSSLNCVIHCKDQELRYAHSAVLSKRPDTEYFTAALKWKEIDSKERQEFVLNFENFSSATVDLLLDWLYLGRLPVFNANELIKLYLLADEVQMGDLKTQCKKELQRAICLDHSLIYTLMIDYWHQGDIHPVLVDFFFNLLPDFCNLQYGFAFPEKRLELAEVLEKMSVESDHRYALVISFLKNPVFPDKILQEKFGDKWHEILIKTAEQDFLFSIKLLLYRLEVDNNVALEYATKAAAKNSLSGLTMLGNANCDLNNKQKAVDCFSEASKMGYAAALNCLAFCYYEGIGVKEDQKRAREMWLRAAESGSIGALTHLATISKDRTYLYKAAALGGIDACKQLAKLLSQEGNEKEAIQYFNLAIDLGSINTIRMLGNHYFNKRNCIEAVKQYQLGIEEGDKGSIYNLAICYFFGDGVPHDRNRAIELFRQAAEMGIERAKTDLFKIQLGAPIVFKGVL